MFSVYYIFVIYKCFVESPNYYRNSFIDIKFKNLVKKGKIFANFPEYRLKIINIK